MRSPTSLPILQSFAIAAVVCICSPLAAQNRDWANSVDGNWFTPESWNPADVPNTAGETARFNAGGTYEVLHLGGSTTVGGIDWNDTGATLTIGATELNNVHLTVNSDLTINGTIDFTSPFSSRSVLLTGNGSITNASTGTINFNGANDVIRRIDTSALMNNGTINVGQNASFGGATNRVITNTGAINIGTGAVLDFGVVGGFAFNQDGGTLANQGAFRFNNGTLNFNGGNFTGNAIELFNTTFNNNATGTGVFNMTGTGSYSGNLVAGQTLNLLAFTGTNTSTTATADFTNFSTLNMTSSGNSILVNLVRNNGTITNGASGTINFNGSSEAAPRQINAQTFVNNGTLNVDQNARFSGSNDRVITNTGAINIASGATLDFGVNSPTFNQNGGTLNNQGTFRFAANGTLNFNGGNFIGNAVELINTTFNNNATGTGVFNMTGTGSYNGDLVAGQTLNLLAAASSHHVTNATANFTNSGTLSLTSDFSGLNVTLDRPGSSALERITNAAGGTINFDGTSSSSSRRILAAIDNQGQINNFAAGTISQIGNSASDHFNSGIITNFDAGGTLAFNGDSFTNQAGGTLAGLGEFDFSATGLTNAGTIDPGLSAGLLTLDGNVELLSTSNLLFEIGGTTAGTDFDALIFLDSLTLGGDLSVSFIDGFQNTIGESDVFSILSAGNLSGTFAGLANGDRFNTADGLGSFQVSYSGNSVMLGSFQAVPEPSMLAMAALVAFPAIMHRRRNGVNA